MAEQVHGAETKYALFQHTQVAGHNTFDMLRELGESELHEIRNANSVVREAAWNTPHHAFAEARERAQAALLEVATETTEALDVRKDRFATAIEELLTAATAHATDWANWLADATPPDNPVDADTAATQQQDTPESNPVETHADRFARFNTSEPVKTAHALITASDFAVTVIPGEVSDAELLSPSNGICVRLSDWTGALAPELTLLAHAGFELIQPQLDRASKLVHAIFAESPAGSPVIAPAPSPTDGWTAKFTLESVDIGAARAAQALALQARSLANDITRRGDRKHQPDRPTAPAPEAADASIRLDGEGATQTEPASLTSVVPDLHRIVDALGTTLDGLASAWAQRFPAQEYVAALQVEKQQASSLLLPIQRALESQGTALKDVGHAGELPGYPLQPGEVAAWSSEASPKLLWTYESTALMHALHQHVQALEDLGIPARLAIAGGSVTTLEFEPLRTATLRASGHLIARLSHEVSSTTASMVDGNLTTHVPATQTGDLKRAAILSLSLGLPEALLIYVIRLCDALALDLSDDETALIETARREVGGYVSGRPTSIGVVHVLADSLARIIDRQGAHLGREAESSGGD